MIFTLTDREYNALDAYETDDYMIGQYLESFLETLDLNVEAKAVESEHWVRGNYIMCRTKDGKGYWFTIYDDEDSVNDDYRQLNCFSGTIDIVGEDATPIEAPNAKPFSWYFDKIFLDTGITIGTNEIAHLKRKLEFTSENATNAEMLQFVLNGFDKAEARLDVEFNGVVPTKLTLNIYKRIGNEQAQILLSDDDDSLTDLTRKGTISELATCINPVGASEDNKEITLKGKYYEQKVDGEIAYISPKNDTRIFSVGARRDFYVSLPGKANGEYDGYINRRYKSEAKTQDALWTESLTQLKAIDHVKMEYESNGILEGSIGDQVQVISHSMVPAVMVTARMTESQTNEDDPSRNTYKFSNYVNMVSKISQIREIMDKLKEQYAVYRIEYASSNGLAFKNGKGESVVSIMIYRDNVNVTGNIADESLRWEKILPNGTHDVEWERQNSRVGKQITVKGSDPSTYTVYLVAGLNTVSKTFNPKEEAAQLFATLPRTNPSGDVNLAVMQCAQIDYDEGYIYWTQRYQGAKHVAVFGDRDSEIQSFNITRTDLSGNYMDQMWCIGGGHGTAITLEKTGTKTMIWSAYYELAGGKVVPYISRFVYKADHTQKFDGTLDFSFSVADQENFSHVWYDAETDYIAVTCLHSSVNTRVLVIKKSDLLAKKFQVYYTFYPGDLGWIASKHDVQTCALAFPYVYFSAGMGFDGTGANADYNFNQVWCWNLMSKQLEYHLAVQNVDGNFNIQGSTSECEGIYPVTDPGGNRLLQINIGGGNPGVRYNYVYLTDERGD